MMQPFIVNLKAIERSYELNGETEPANTNPLLELLRCSVCYEIPFTPVHPPKCHHICCSKCFAQWSRVNTNGGETTCPVCRGKYPTSQVVDVLKTTLGGVLYSELSMRCPNECGDQIRLGLMRRHLIAECKVRIVRCPFGCGYRVTWCKIATQHIFECSKAYHRCAKCTLPVLNIQPGENTIKHDCLNHALTVIQRM